MIGKQFKFKLLETAIPREVTDVRNGFVIFDDGSRIEENRISELFDEVGVSASTPAISSVAPVAPVAKFADDVVNPETFFDNAKTTEYITKEASKINTVQLDDQGSSYHGATTIEKPMESIVPESPDGVRRYEATRKDFSEEDKRYAGYGPAKVDPYVAKSELSSISFFQNLKRSKKVKLVLEIEEMIPKTDFIRMMDENFNGGVINFLVTDMVTKLLKKPQLLESYIKEALEEIVYNKKRKPRVKKVVEVKSVVKDEQEKEEKTEVKNEDT